MPRGTYIYIYIIYIYIVCARWGEAGERVRRTCLLLKVSEEHHHLVEDGVHLLLRSALHPLAHLLVDKERNVPGGEEKGGGG